MNIHLEIVNGGVIVEVHTGVGDLTTLWTRTAPAKKVLPDNLQAITYIASLLNLNVEVKEK